MIPIPVSDGQLSNGMSSGLPFPSLAPIVSDIY